MNQTSPQFEIPDRAMRWDGARSRRADREKRGAGGKRLAAKLATSHSDPALLRADDVARPPACCGNRGALEC
jgi:hypothetical protein